jgi:hypothetical protein
MRKSNSNVKIAYSDFDEVVVGLIDEMKVDDVWVSHFPLTS